MQMATIAATRSPDWCSCRSTRPPPGVSLPRPVSRPSCRRRPWPCSAPPRPATSGVLGQPSDRVDHDDVRLVTIVRVVSSTVCTYLLDGTRQQHPCGPRSAFSWSFDKAPRIGAERLDSSFGMNGSYFCVPTRLRGLRRSGAQAPNKHLTGPGGAWVVSAGRGRPRLTRFVQDFQGTGLHGTPVPSRAGLARLAMNVYRWVWGSAWSAISVVPVFLGLLIAPPVALFCLGAIAATAAGMAGFRTAGCILAGVVAAMTVGMFWATGPMALALVALAASTSPYVALRIVRRLAGKWAWEPAPDPCAAAQGLGTRRLCAAWSESYAELCRAQTLVERLEIVQLRQAYLDELEIRNGKGFRAWLDSGARPVGNPAGFVDPQ